MLTDAGTQAEVKKALRAEVAAACARLSADDRARASLAIADRLDALDLLRAARTVGLYAPIRGEVDALEAGRRLAARGARLAFPRVVPGRRRMDFAACPASALVRGPLGAGEPPPDAPALEPAELDAVLVPGIAFSLDGHRLGRGGGHYDTTLAALPAAARIGVAFEAQLIDRLPHEPHDAPLDALVTEARTLRFSRESR